MLIIRMTVDVIVMFTFYRQVTQTLLKDNDSLKWLQWRRQTYSIFQQYNFSTADWTQFLCVIHKPQCYVAPYCSVFIVFPLSTFSSHVRRTKLLDLWFCGFYPALLLNGGLWPGGVYVCGVMSGHQKLHWANLTEPQQCSDRMSQLVSLPEGRKERTAVLLHLLTLVVVKPFAWLPSKHGKFCGMLNQITSHVSVKCT